MEKPSGPEKPAKKNIRAPVSDRPQVRLRHQMELDDEERFVPRPSKDLTKEKEKFISWLDGSDKLEQNVKRARQNAHYGDYAAEEEEEVDEFALLINEISERQQWLADMEALGQAEPFRSRIDFEIKARIKRLHELEKNRSN